MHTWEERREEKNIQQQWEVREREISNWVEERWKGMKERKREERRGRKRSKRRKKNRKQKSSFCAHTYMTKTRPESGSFNIHLFSEKSSRIYTQFIMSFFFSLSLTLSQCEWICVSCWLLLLSSLSLSFHKINVSVVERGAMREERCEMRSWVVKHSKKKNNTQNIVASAHTSMMCESEWERESASESKK